MTKRSIFFRSKSIEKVLNWLDVNYELKEGICLPRCLLYKHYLDFCHTNKELPVSAAAFGKIIRKKFNKITTRRLGTRGQSKYHYFGLSIKKTSIYYKEFFANTLNSKIKLRKFVPREKSKKFDQLSVNIANDLIKNFVRTSDFQRPSFISFKKLETFLVMYKNHCQRILDIIVTSRVEQIPNYLSHFWLEIPFHLYTLISTDFLSKVIECCDFILYEALLSAIFPKCMKDLPQTCVENLNILSNNFEIWLRNALNKFPIILVNRKMEALNQFLRSIKRYLSLLHFMKSCSFLLNRNEILKMMSNDLKSVDLSNILEDFSIKCTHQSIDIFSLIINFFLNIHKLNDQNLFMSSLRMLFQKFLITCRSSCIISRSTQFILILNQFFICISRELTLQNAATLTYWNILFTNAKELSMLIAEDAIRRDVFQVKKMSITQMKASIYSIN